MEGKGIVSRKLPDGETAKVFPFHVCTEGRELVFRDDEDLRVAHNLIPICATRANVIVVADIVLNTHIHTIVLARTRDDAAKFINGFKISISKHLSGKYHRSCQFFRYTDSTPIYLDNEFYIRNAVCYVFRNSLDVGVPVDRYRLSSYRAVFNRETDESLTPVKNFSARRIRDIFKTHDKLNDVAWMLNSRKEIEPSSYCDSHYIEILFNRDVRYFMRVLGLTDDSRMDMDLIKRHLTLMPMDELVKEIENRSMRLYKSPSSSLSIPQKITLLKVIYHSCRTTPLQLARCLNVPIEFVKNSLKR